MPCTHVHVGEEIWRSLGQACLHACACLCVVCANNVALASADVLSSWMFDSKLMDCSALSCLFLSVDDIGFYICVMDFQLKMTGSNIDAALPFRVLSGWIRSGAVASGASNPVDRGATGAQGQGLRWLLQLPDFALASVDTAFCVVDLQLK